MAALRRAGLVTLSAVAGLLLGVAATAGLLQGTALATVALTAAILLVAYAGTVLDKAGLIQRERRSALAVRNLSAGCWGRRCRSGGAS